MTETDIKSCSVVIALKNEESNISGLIESLTSQNYPENKFEVILVDDYSTDRTVEIITDLIKGRSNFRILRNSENGIKTSGKKSALEYGINNSNYNYLLFTDADCRPGIHWIDTMMKGFKGEVSFVFGYSPYLTNRNFLGSVIDFENMQSSFLMKSMYNLNLPYLCFGRNMGFEKISFFRVGGYKEISHSLSGDDDLLLQLFVREKLKVLFVEGNESVVFSIPVTNYKDYFRKKIRHYSAGKFYSIKIKLFLILFYLTNYFMIFLLIASFWSGKMILAYSGMAVFLILAFQKIIISKRIRNKKVNFNFLILEIIFPVFAIIPGILSRRKNIRW